MDAQSFPAAGPQAARSLLSVPRGSRISASGQSGFPKSVRLLRSSEFRQVYDQGTRHTCAAFAAFCLANGGLGCKVGFTTPRGLGKAVVRNRIRRRLREAVRLELELLSPEWSIVFNPRRKTFDCPFPDLRAEVRKLFLRCRPSPPAVLPESSTSTNA